MATHNTPLYAAQNGAVAGFPDSILSQGKLRFASVVIPTGTVLVEEDVVNLVTLPRNARIIPSLSVTIAGHATGEVTIGDAGDADRYAAAVKGTARAYLSAFGDKADASVTAGNEDITATVTTGATLATDWRLYIAYVI